MKDNIKKIIKDWRTWLILASITVIIIILIILLAKPKFEITDFSITSETSEYTYIEDTTTYNGKGIITTRDKKGTYLVAMKVVLKSGGTDNSEKEYYTTIMVSNGKGQFSTYESGNKDKIKKPDYDFEILGYVKF